MRHPRLLPLLLSAGVTACSSSNAQTPTDAAAPDAAVVSDAGALDEEPASDGAPANDAPSAGSSDSGAPTVTTLAALLANDTSASPRFVDQYTPAARFSGGASPVSNGDAPTSTTTAADLRIGRVSKVPVKSLLYPGATTQVFVETQSWFCTNGLTPIPTAQPADQCGSHIDIGYSTN
jgi:hypothetical protein